MYMMLECIDSQCSIPLSYSQIFFFMPVALRFSLQMYNYLCIVYTYSVVVSEHYDV